MILETAPAMTKMLEKLRKDTGLPTKGEVARRAISIYVTLFNAHTEGHRIVLMDKKGKLVKELLVV